jgi:hypothetical protein
VLTVVKRGYRKMGLSVNAGTVIFRYRFTSTDKYRLRGHLHGTSASLRQGKEEYTTRDVPE